MNCACFINYIFFVINVIMNVMIMFVITKFMNILIIITIVL